MARIDTELRATPDVQAATPADPVAALLRLGRDRLKAYGTSGRALFAVTEVSLQQHAGGIGGSFGVELDIYTSNNTRAAYAEARVYRRIEADGDTSRGAVYDLEKQLMEAMNVELEFQVRRSLKAWVAAAPSPAVPAPVEQQVLPPPGASPAGASGSPPMLNLAPPAPVPATPPRPPSPSLTSPSASPPMLNLAPPPAPMPAPPPPVAAPGH